MNKSIFRIMALMSFLLINSQLIAASSDENHATVEHLENGLSRITLTPKAEERLDIELTQVEHENDNGHPKLTVPYSTIIYDTDGKTWVYISPEKHTYLRHRVVIDHIDDDYAILSEGPSVGTQVVIIGVAELYGIEKGIGK